MFDNLLKLIDFIRPKFYNKITWFLVSSGVLLASQPLWEEVLRALLDKHLQIKISLPDNEIIGLFLVTLGLIYHLLATSINHYALTKKEYTQYRKDHDKISLQRNHDIKLFKELTDVFEEYYLTNYVSSLADDHSYLSSEKERLMSIIFLANKSGTYFLNENIDSEFSRFIKSLDSLMSWCGQHFFRYPDDVRIEDPRYCLYPELNCERAGYYSATLSEKYEIHSKKLDELIDDIKSRYMEFRSAVKRELYI